MLCSLGLLAMVISLGIPEVHAESDAESSLLEKSLDRITRLYLHPEVIDPAAMVRDGIQNMEHADPSLLVTEEGASGLMLRAGARTLEINLEDVHSLGDVQGELEAAADFIASDTELALDAEDLHISAIQGLLRTVDRHSRLIVGGNLDEFNTRFKGTLVGIGARIGRRQGMLRIIEPFPSTPAAKAGLLPGDGVSHIDGHPTAALSVEDAVERIRGPEGVPVVLTIQREDEPGRRVFVIVRAKVRVPSVKSERLPDDIGFIRIDHFSQKTSIEVAEHLDELKKLGELHGLIIDVRENTGGSMRHAARIVNYFVPEGVLVRTEGPDGQPVAKLTDRIEADSRRFRFDGPVAVLVDSRTASGSEILAGGLKYLGRSITIGAQTFGNGTVQKVYPLRKEGKRVSLKLTVARYLLPGDTFINSVGVTPDIMTGLLWLDPEELTLPDRLREPATYSGAAAGRGGLDSRRNPGGGRVPTTEGSNRAPRYRIAYPRVSSAWDPASVDGQSKGPDASESDSPRAAAEAETLSRGRAWPSLPGDAGETQFNDLDLRLAHELLLAAPATARRAELLELAGPIISTWQQRQTQRLSTALKQRGISWATWPTGWLDRSPEDEEVLESRLLGPTPPVEVSVELPESLVAGEASEVRVTVRNTTKRPLPHQRARMESSSAVLRRLDFLLGDVPPGGEASWTVPLLVPASAASRADTWRLYLIDDDGALGAPFAGKVTTRAAPLPVLEARIKTQAQPQQDGSLLLLVEARIRNTGSGDAGEVQLHFGSPEEDGVERLERWASIEALASGEEDRATLSLRVRNPARIDEVVIRLRVRDRVSRSATTFALRLSTQGTTSDSGWLSPPTVSMLRPSRHDAASGAESDGPYHLLGSVRSDAGLSSVEVSLGRDKIFTSSPVAAGEALPVRVDINTTAALRSGPNRVRVKARSSEGVEVTHSSWVLGVPTSVGE
jgi:carboxyl-terminal processing protease